MIELLRESKNDKINIARYAYLLKRGEEKNNKINTPLFYKWIQDKTQRKELEIAITLYSYKTRE